MSGILLLGLLLFSSCKKDSGPEGGDINPQVPQLPSGVELNEKTLQITDIQTEALSSVDSDNAVLCFSSNLPESQVPQVGQILLQLSPTDKLPYGFLGKVSGVKDDGQTITVSTTAVDLDEAFDKLNLSVDVEMQPVESEDGVKSVTKGETADGVSFIAGFTEEDVIGEEDNNVAFEASVSMGGSINVSTAVDNSKKQNDITVNCSVLVGFEYLIKAHIEKEDDFSYPIGKPIKICTPSSLAIQPSIQFNIVTAYSGSIDMQYCGASSCVYPFSFGRKNGVLYNSFNSETLAGKDTEVKKELEISADLMLSLNMEGSLYFGLVPEISFKLFGRNEMKLTAMPSIGYEFSGEIEIEMKESTGTGDEDSGDGNGEDKGDKTLYQMFKDEYLTAALQCGVNFGINFFGLKGETDFDKYTLKEDKKYLFPRFNTPEQTKDGSYTKFATTVERDLLIPMEIGLGLYEKELLSTGLETPVSKSDTYKYSFKDGFANPLTASFVIPQSQTVYPCITIGTQTIRADWGYNIVGKWRLYKTYDEGKYVSWNENAPEQDWAIFEPDGTYIYVEQTGNEIEVYQYSYSIYGDIIKIIIEDGEIDYDPIYSLNSDELVIGNEEWRDYYKRVSSVPGFSGK